MTNPQSSQSVPEFRSSLEDFDKLYRGEPMFEGGPKPTGVPWDVRQAQPRVTELEALGGFSGEVLDIGCGLGDNAIYLATRGHTVTGLDGSATAIEQARSRAAAAGVSVTFGVADATELAGFEGQFDTVVDSALYHCLDDAGRQNYAAALFRATRPGARWHLYCFSGGNINGIVAPMAAIPTDTIRDTLTANGWRIDFLGPTTYLGNASAFFGSDDLSQSFGEQLPPESMEQMRDLAARFDKISDLLDGDQVHLPFTVVHAHRVD